VTKIFRPRDLIDRKALMIALNDRCCASRDGVQTQEKSLVIFKNTQRRGWNEVRHRFEGVTRNAFNSISEAAYLVDQLVRTIQEFASSTAFPSGNPTTGEEMALLATGGYGRQELAPYSDIDIMFLLPYKITARSEQIIEFVLYMLWDIGLNVGHATRSVNEALSLAKKDLTIRTSLLESRWLWGNQKLAAEFKRRFVSEIVSPSGPEFVKAKLAERDARHERLGDTRYVLEPNIKEGKGGLRDLQTLLWIAKYLYKVERIDDLLAKQVFIADDIRRFKKAAKFFWTVRCHLHYISMRAEERLTFDVQNEIGRRMRYRNSNKSRGVERFMKHYFLITKDVGDLTRTLCSVLEDQHKKSWELAWLPSFRAQNKVIEGFELDGSRLSVRDGDEFKADPMKLLQLFYFAQKHKLDIHPNALRGVSRHIQLVNRRFRKNPIANQLFIKILLGLDPDIALTRLNESGIMGRFLPDFGRVVAQMQYDMYHVYTVDEHTIRAIGILYGIETGRLKKEHSIACSVIGEIESRRVLYLALLLHDIAKGRGGDHSLLGADIALELGRRFSFSEWETQTVSWLVKHHLLMSSLAFKRDIEDPQTVKDFIKIVQSPERLRLLLVLTVADIRAVGPNVWSAWKAGLLKELFWRAQEALSGVGPPEHRQVRVEKVKDALMRSLSEWSQKKILDLFEHFHEKYWLGVDPELQVRHAKLMVSEDILGKGFKIDFHYDYEKEILEVSVYAPDHPGLFASISGAISLMGASIVDAKIQTLNNGMALDSFLVQSLRSSGKTKNIDVHRLRSKVEDAIQGKISVSKELSKARQSIMLSRSMAFKIPPGVLIDNNASQNYTVIEINGRDRPGLLYDVTSVLTKMGIQISSSHISTYGERVVDVFYVKDIFGLKIISESKLKQVRTLLLASINIK